MAVFCRPFHCGGITTALKRSHTVVRWSQNQGNRQTGLFSLVHKVRRERAERRSVVLVCDWSDWVKGGGRNAERGWERQR